MKHSIHHVPGRLRVRAAGLKKNRPQAAQVADLLGRLPAVTSAEANPLTGSVTVFYDRTAVDLDALAQALRKHCGIPDDSLPDARALLSTPMPCSSKRCTDEVRAKVMKAVARSAVQFLLERAVEQALLTLLAGLL